VDIFGKEPERRQGFDGAGVQGWLDPWQ